MYTLHLCIGMFLAICGSARDYDYPDLGQCEKARVTMQSKVGDGYAICIPKELNKTAEKKEG